MGGGYHDDSRNYFPKSQGLSAEPPATGGAAAPFLLFQVLLPKTKKKMFWLLLYLLSWPPVRSVADVNDPESHSRRINEFTGPAEPLSDVYLSRDA